MPGETETTSNIDTQWEAYDTEQAEAERDEFDKAGKEFWTPGVGKTQFRMLPGRPGQKGPFVITWDHMIQVPGMQKKVRFACPRMLAKKRCPGCEKADELRKTGNVADRDAGFEISAQPKALCLILIRGKEELGIKKWGVGKKLHEQLREMLDVAGDFSNPVDGFDLILVRKGTGKEDTQYTLFADRRNSPLGPTPDETAAWLTAREDLSFYRLPKGYDEILKLTSPGGGGSRRGQLAARRGAPTAEDDMHAPEQEVGAGGRAAAPSGPHRPGARVPDEVIQPGRGQPPPPREPGADDDDPATFPPRSE